MAFRKLCPEQTEDNTCLAGFGYRIMACTLFHPLNYTKVLMQLGHEPLPLYSGRSMVYFGSKKYMLPNAIGYMRHIYCRDGFFGLFNGWHASVGSSLCGMLAYKKVYEYLDERFPDKEIKKDDLCVQRFSRNFVQLSKQTVAKVVSLIAAQPLRVIMLRTMAEFIGQEGGYRRGIVHSVKTIYNESGILGFFRGLMPELIAELCLMWITAQASFLIDRVYYELIAPEEEAEEEETAITVMDQPTPKQMFRHVVRLIVPYAASSFFYPFHLTSVLMAVNDCGLLCGQPPNCPVFEDWKHCFEYLKNTNQMKRGSKLFFRCYDGPVTYRNGEMYALSHIMMAKID
uniref:Mitochondrial carrier homolog 2 n=1 Tax=Trichuris muris TaxID=70415 RepID=A0A5S6R1T2_TRIMR